MKSIIITTILIVFVFACNKEKLEKEDDLHGSETIRGRLFLYDVETRESYGTPLANKKVFINYSNRIDSLNYLYSVQTDVNGYFVFNNLKENSSYKIYFEDTVGDILFTADTIMEASSDSLPLTASIKEQQQGVILSLLDASGSGKLKDVKTCFFSSALLFTGGTCEGSNFTLTSNQHGKAFGFKLARGTYYLFSTITVNNQLLSSRDTIVIGDNITRKNILLKPSGAANGVKFLVLDALGTRIPDAELCFFTSSVLFRKDTCGGSNFQVRSAQDGIASKSGIFKSYYYVYGHKMIDSTHSLVGKDSLLIADDVKVDTIRLY